MGDDLKRKSGADHGDTGSKRQKSQRNKNWKTSHKPSYVETLDAGQSGIWAACDRGTEGKCTIELRDIFNEYASKLYGDAVTNTLEAHNEDDDEDGEPEVDIEAEISNEINDIKQGSRKPLFKTVNTYMKCLLFFKTRAPIDPVELVHRICIDAQEGTLPFRSRFIKRLTPITLYGKASEKGIDDVSKAVLGPHFHGDSLAKKFAIRPSIRNNNTLDRDTVIKRVADAVGSGHSVDLKNYDACILVEVYKNLCGIAVVGEDYEKLKRFNLAEIWKERKEQGSGGGPVEKAVSDPETASGSQHDTLIASKSSGAKDDA